LATIQEAAGAAIAAQYGIEGASITKWRWGWPGESFIVSAPGGRRYFGKLFYTRDAWRAPDESLIVLEQLRDAGIDRLTFPLRTSNGGRSVYLGERRMVLFEFIDGRSGSAGFDFPEYAGIMARVHATDVPGTRELERDTFDLGFINALDVAMKQLWASAGVTAPQMGLRRFFKPDRAMIEANWEELLRLADTCRDIATSRHITHSDALDHNVLVNDAGQVFVIDWDEMMYGPAERDTWYWLYGERATPFLHEYRKLFPAYHPNPTLCRFYLLRRYFEDLAGVVEEIDKRPVESAQEMLDTVTSGWENWLGRPVRMARPRDE
jgi:Ser/Thr protein kinase RdoA (MazF antagonist)